MLKLIKRKVLLATLVFSSLFSSQAFAGNFTNPNPNVNSNYNRTNAQYYIDCHATSPNWDYRYFSGGDCTNFASQVLHYGGLYEENYGYDYLSSWYYNNYYDYSLTWIRAHEFRYHWANINGSGYNLCYQYKTYTYQTAKTNFSTIYNDLWPGDIVQWVDENGHTNHSQVIQSWGGGELYVAQHTPEYANGHLSQILNNYQNKKGWFVTIKIKQAAS